MGQESLFSAALHTLDVTASTAQAWWARQGVLRAEALAGERLESLVAFARERSPFYSKRYAQLPPGAALRELPPVTRGELMAAFDDWSTDRAVNREGVEAFLADPGSIGGDYLGRYAVWKSSGTRGRPGIFVQDRHALAVYDALVCSRLDTGAWLEASPRAAAAGARAALVVATGDHYASIASWRHIERAWPHGAMRSFSVLDPLPELRAGLQEFRPAFLAAYPSMLRLLAAEQAAGRLSIAPALVWSGGEHLAPRHQKEIERAFGCPVVNEYGASECLSIASSCREGWLHVNADWVIVEPVDARLQPVPPGQESFAILVTNLANRVQPVIRYVLDDRVTLRAGPCPCASPLPALRVEGRTGELLRVRGAHGTVSLAPLALETVVEEAAGMQRFQVACRNPSHLSVRLERKGTWPRVARALRAWLDSQGAREVHLSLERRPAKIDPRSGKLSPVIVVPR